MPAGWEVLPPQNSPFRVISFGKSGKRATPGGKDCLTVNLHNSATKWPILQRIRPNADSIILAGPCPDCNDSAGRAEIATLRNTQTADCRVPMMRSVLLKVAPRTLVLHLVSLAIGIVFLANGPALRADEPPIHPQNQTWNSYLSSDQYHPGWGNHGAAEVCCPLPTNRWQLPGWRGAPYTDQRLSCRNCKWGRSGNGCQPSNRPGISASVHWPRPFSSFWSDSFPGHSGPHSCHPSGMSNRRSAGHVFDALDPLADLKLFPSPRRDSGYFGNQCDPYGKLGRSQQPISNAGSNESVPGRRPRYTYPQDTRAALRPIDSQVGSHPVPGSAGAVSYGNLNIRRTDFRQTIPSTYSGFTPAGGHSALRSPSGESRVSPGR